MQLRLMLAQKAVMLICFLFSRLEICSTFFLSLPITRIKRINCVKVKLMVLLHCVQQITLRNQHFLCLIS